MSRYSKNKISNWVAGIAVHRSARAIFITLIVALFMVMTGALPALAVSWWKIYPGSMGVRSAGTITPEISYSAIGNPSTSTSLYLDLPVISDSTFNSIDVSSVRVVDLHPSSNISCRMCSVYHSISQCIWYGSYSPIKYSSGSGCAEQVLSTGGVSANDRSHHYLSCKIPPKYNNKISYIISYKVEKIH